MYTVNTKGPVVHHQKRIPIIHLYHLYILPHSYCPSDYLSFHFMSLCVSMSKCFSLVHLQATSLLSKLYRVCLYRNNQTTFINSLYQLLATNLHHFSFILIV